MKRKKLLAMSIAAVSVVLVFAGCSSSGQVNDISKTGVNEVANDTPQVNSTWAEAYPLEYGSYLEGADNEKTGPGYEPGTEITRAHSHALMEQSMLDLSGDTEAVSCLSCHAAYDYRALYEEYGDEVASIPWSKIKSEHPNVQFWSCLQCHEEEPGGTLTTTSAWWKNAAADYDFSDSDAVCGQCHGMGNSQLGVYNADRTFDYYKYGLDVDDLYRASMELSDANGSVMYDEATGMRMEGYGAEGTVEIFQNGTHQSLGMSCVSCHMPTDTDEDGATFTSHNASGSPLENPAALEYCLTCHEAQGISDADAMVEFVRDRQNELASAGTKFSASLDELYNTIVQMQGDETVSQDTLEKMMDAYEKAYFYQRYTGTWELFPVESNYGVKAAHNFDGYSGIIARGQKLIDDALALA